MAYGIIKVDQITFTNGGIDQTVTVSGIVQSISGNITATGTIQGATIIGTSTVSGATVTGDSGQYGSLTAISGVYTTQLSGTTITGDTIQASTVTGVSGVYTTQLSGATITGDTGNYSELTAISGVFTTQISGVTITGDIGQYTTLTGISGVFTTAISGATITGDAGDYSNLTAISGVFTTQISGTTVTGDAGSFATVTGGVATITSGVFALGEEALPSISFSSDPDTGIYSPGADQLALSTNGTPRVQFGTSEVVFNDDGNNYDFRIEGDTVSNLFFVDASADAVGIGATNVDELLHVESNGATPKIKVESTLANSSPGFRVTNDARSYDIRIDGTNDNLQFYDATASEGRVAIDSSGRLLVGTVSSLQGNSLIQAHAGSGTNAIRVSSTLSDGESADFRAAAGSRITSLGIYKHSGITNPCAYVNLVEEDGTNAYVWTDNSGNLRISSTVTHIGTTSGTVVGTQTSDERIKNILGPVEYGLEAVKQIEPVRYALKSEPDTEKLGFIAQQVQPLIPQSVFDTKEHIEGEPEDAPTKLGMEYVALIPVLVNAIKELSAEVDALKAQLKTQ